jgi:hypothetical protein
MTETKYFEIRDWMTHLPAFAVRLNPLMKADARLHRGMHWRLGDTPVYLVHPGVQVAHHSPHGWRDRTMCTAHEYIVEHWDELESGAVIDVEYILGETLCPKPAQRMGG